MTVPEIPPDTRWAEIANWVVAGLPPVMVVFAIIVLLLQIFGVL